LFSDIPRNTIQHVIKQRHNLSDQIVLMKTKLEILQYKDYMQAVL